MSVYSSTYRNVVKSLGDLILAHPAVKTFRVGPPSDIEMPTDTKMIARKIYSKIGQ